MRLRPGTKHFDGDALVVARAAGELAGYGLEPRHLRAFKTAADREVGLVEQAVAPLRGHRDPGSQARSEEAVRQIRQTAPHADIAGFAAATGQTLDQPVSGYAYGSLSMTSHTAGVPCCPNLGGFAGAAALGTDVPPEESNI